MANTKPIGVAYEDQYLDGATIANPVYPAQGAALTAQLTTVSASAPVAADFTVQDLVNPGFGFVNANEAQTVMAVMINLQTRVAELESRLQALNLIA
jgi:hypothetical protein